jgi:hypothetical protein
MARRNGALDLLSSAWFHPFVYPCDSDDVPAFASLQAMGVCDAEFVISRLEDGSFFTALMFVSAEERQAVDVAWLMRVRQVCEEAGPSLLSKMVLVSGPVGDHPDPYCRDLVLDGEPLLFVRVGKDGNVLRALVAVAIPRSDVVATEAPA